MCFTAVIRVLLAFILLLQLCSCVSEAEQLDLEQQSNPYTNDYIFLYKNYGKLPSDTLEKLTLNYLSRFKYAGHAKLYLGRLYYDKKAYHKALDVYKDAYQDDSLYTAAAIQMGIIYRLTNQFDSAEYYLKKGLKNDALGYVSFNMAYIDFLKGDSTLALEAIGRLQDTQLNQPNNIGMGWLACRLGKDSIGNIYFKKAAFKDTIDINLLREGQIGIDDFYSKHHI